MPPMESEYISTKPQKFQYVAFSSKQKQNRSINIQVKNVQYAFMSSRKVRNKSKN